MRNDKGKATIEKEWRYLLKQEEKFFKKRLEKKESNLNQKLEEKVPEQLQLTLDKGFNKAFKLIFEKGTGVIEKTYKREELEQNYRVQQFASDLRNDRKSLRAISRSAGQSGVKNLMLSGAVGVGLGALGIGIPDIPIFTGMIIKSIYEMALSYGYQYETPEERAFILLLIQGAVSYGEELQQIDQEVNTYIVHQHFSRSYTQEELLQQTSAVLSKELLYMKFLQGIPIVGVVGGAYDIIYMKKITEYAALKYKQRYLYHQRTKR